MRSNHIVIAKTWRSEISSVVVFLVLSALSVFLTRLFPSTLITGKVVSAFGYSLVLSLPLFWLIPLMAAGSIIYRIYNVRFLMDSRGIEAKVGILALNQRITRIRFEDIRSVETQQSMLERALNIGNVEIGTAATGDVEVTLQGVAAPTEVQEMIQAERDRRQSIARERREHPIQQRVTA